MTNANANANAVRVTRALVRGDRDDWNARSRAGWNARSRARASASASASGSPETRLASWLRNRFAFDALALTLERPPGDDGYGVRATCVCDDGIARGDVIVAIPRDAMLDARSALGDAAFERARARGLSSFQLLTVSLLREWRLKDTTSRWKPYLDTLPEDDGRWHPLLWRDEDVEQHLPANSTHAGARLRGLIRACEEDTRLFRSIVDELNIDDENWPSMRHVRWAVSIVISRAFQLNELDDEECLREVRDDALLETLNDLDADCWEGSGGDSGEDDEFSVMALVPWADGLNHSSDAGDEAILTYDTLSQTATLRAHKAYACGEQVFDSYGSNLSDEDLFVNYGFVDVQSSRTNFVEFSGEDFLRAASEIGFQMHAKAEDDDISFIDPKAALLRVDSVVGVGENAMFFGECFLEYNEQDVENVVLRTFSHLLDSASTRACDDLVVKARETLGNLREGDTLVGFKAAAYVLCREQEAIEAARSAVARQLSMCDNSN